MPQHTVPINLVTKSHNQHCLQLNGNTSPYVVCIKSTLLQESQQSQTHSRDANRPLLITSFYLILVTRKYISFYSLCKFLNKNSSKCQCY